MVKEDSRTEMETTTMDGGKTARRTDKENTTGNQTDRNLLVSGMTTKEEREKEPIETVEQSVWMIEFYFNTLLRINLLHQHK
jgi:hypothetical protein